MAIIKSAFELAMERTKDIAGDKEALEASAVTTEGKKIVSRFIDDREVKIRDELKSYEKKKLEWVREGMLQALLANLVLPYDELGMQRNRRIADGLGDLGKGGRQIGQLFTQMEDFFKEYMEERKRVRDLIEDRYSQKLKQKEQELSRQMGTPVRIDPAQDPEFVSLLRQNMGNLEARYSEVLSRVKEQITGLIRG
jgi:F0F1-type ATP synthase membrane subunit b/b'